MIGGSANRSWLVDQRQMAVYSNTFTTFMRTEKHTMHIKVESGPAPSKALSPLLHTSNILLSFEKSTPPKGVELRGRRDLKIMHFWPLKAVFTHRHVTYIPHAALAFPCKRAITIPELQLQRTSGGKNP